MSGSAERRTPTIQTTSLQIVGVLVATVFVGALHWTNDGLWFQGDAPRHAATGLFMWDYLVSLPAEPLSFALSYYARYPVITPLIYPPLFYVIEGFAFGLIAPSPYLAKALVLAFAGAIGIYTMAWARRWGGPAAGWAGPSVVLLPGFVEYANAILLNVPATAFVIGALYHLVVSLETGSARHKKLFIALVAAALLTYYPAAPVVPLAFVWILIFKQWSQSRTIWLLPVAVLSIALIVAVVLPTHWARHAPSIRRLWDLDLWSFYGRQVIDLAGLAWTGFGVAGLVIAIITRAHRRQGAALAIAFPVIISCLVVLPAESGRYALPLIPLLVIAAFLGAVSAHGHVRAAHAAVVIPLLLGTAAWSGSAVRVPVVSGFDRAAAYLREAGPTDSVLYSGAHDGVFTFYVRAGDPRFQRRVVLAQRLLARYGQTQNFQWMETPYVESADDVVAVLQRQCGCRWVAVEIGGGRITASERQLRLALQRAEFEHVQSFPIISDLAVRLDVYRFLPSFDPPPPVDLVFPSFSGHVFRAVQPIPSVR